MPDGFATTADAFRDFLSVGDLESRVEARLATLDIEDVPALAAAGRDIRAWILDNPLPEQLESEIRAQYAQLGDNVPVAVRSSATAEDLPKHLSPGNKESFLNVRGIERVLIAVHEVFASLFNDRAIAYRVHQGFTHAEVAISAGIQQMVRSDCGASGVAFTLDTESGFADAVFITASFGLGECVVQGAVNPDEFYVHKPTLAQGRPAILRRHLGSKLIKMVYADPRPPLPVTTVDTTHQSVVQFSLSDAQIESLAGYGDDDRAALWPTHGYRMGARWRIERASHPAGSPGDRAES